MVHRQCRDAEGEHLFVETRLQPARQLQPNGKPHVAELTFYKFTNGPRGYAKRWQARDFVPLDDRLLASAGRNSRVSRANRFVISDVDGDGLAEAFMSYALPGHGQNPDEGKLLLFYKDRKYVIRGAVAAGPADFGSRTLDAGFSSLPQAVQSYALGLWDAVALPGHLAGRPLALTELSPR